MVCILSVPDFGLCYLFLRFRIIIPLSQVWDFRNDLCELQEQATYLFLKDFENFGKLLAKHVW